MGCQEEQAKDELREIESWVALLLRQEHYTQSTREEIRLSVCV